MHNITTSFIIFYNLDFMVSVKWEDKSLFDISVSSSESLYPTLSVCSWSSSNWILNNRASRSSLKWSLLVLISPTTCWSTRLWSHLLRRSNSPRHFRNNIVENIQDIEGFKLPHTLVDLLENKLLDMSPLEQESLEDVPYVAKTRP